LTKVTLLAGGVGGARAARGFAGAVAVGDLAVIVNVGDDDVIYGVHVSADIDTVLYTLARQQGPEGWGLRDDTFDAMDAMAAAGQDVTFRLGDRDLAYCLKRSQGLAAGASISEVTRQLGDSLGVGTRVLPATDDEVRTRVEVSTGEWLSFQEYFVMRGHRDEVSALEYAGAEDSRPAPGVVEAIEGADLIAIAPSNPPLSVWPILAVPGIRPAVSQANRVMAISPLFGGKALKGPADRVMASLGLPPGNAGVLAAYDGLLTDLVVDLGDAGDVEGLASDVRIHAADTRMTTPREGVTLAEHLLEL
jgi:LPPG:FO 2-phospho-L-lactate transferase